MAVEPTSLAVLECAKTDDRSAAAWQEVLQPFTALEFVVSDAAKGIAGGVQAVATRRAETSDATRLEQGLDVFHTAQEAHRVLAGPWRCAEAAWEEAEEADRQVAECRRRGQDARQAAGSARWAWTRAEESLAVVEQQEVAWQRARAALVVFRPDGTLNERSWAEAELGAALAELSGLEWKKVRNFLSDRRSLTFLDRLHRRLAAAEPDQELRQACVRRWWLRHHRPAATAGPATTQDHVQGLLDDVLRQRSLTPVEQAAYDRISAILRTTVRASSAVEGMNSVLRMQQGRHRRMTQGLLDLKRLYWNCRRLTTGKRRGHSPYQMLGVQLPSTDFWALLQTPSPQRTQELSSQQVQI